MVMPMSGRFSSLRSSVSFYGFLNLKNDQIRRKQGSTPLTNFKKKNNLTDQMYGLK